MICHCAFCKEHYLQTPPQRMDDPTHSQSIHAISEISSNRQFHLHSPALHSTRSSYSIYSKAVKKKGASPITTAAPAFENSIQTNAVRDEAGAEGLPDVVPNAIAVAGPCRCNVVHRHNGDGGGTRYHPMYVSSRSRISCQILSF